MIRSEIPFTPPAGIVEGRRQRLGKIGLLTNYRNNQMELHCGQSHC